MCVRRTFHVLVLLACCVAACSPRSSARQYTLEGQILAIRHENNEVLIRHGDIQGFMPGMTMPFKVRNSALLEEKAPGDLVKATLQVDATDAWIETLDKVGSAPLPDSPAAFPAASFVTPVHVGEIVPDPELIDHDGATFSLPAWRGSAIALTFIYIRCPLPQFCPLLDRRFVDVQRAISADASLAGRARLLSVSFDPEADTPARLKAHAAKLQADPAIWRFATAPRDVIDRFSAQFGVNVIREADGTITHNMRTTVIGPDGRVVSTFEGSDWTPDQVVAAMRQSLTR